MSSLYWKVSAVLLLLLLALAVIQRTVWDDASMEFIAETDQKLNRTLVCNHGGTPTSVFRNRRLATSRSRLCRNGASTYVANDPRTNVNKVAQSVTTYGGNATIS